MGRAQVERRWEEFHRTGAVTVRASVAKGILACLAALLLTTFAALTASESFQDDGIASLKGWLCVLVALFFVTGTVLALRPVVRGRRLALSSEGVTMSSRRGGRRVVELGLFWHEIHHVGHHRDGSGDTQSEHVRIVLGHTTRTDEKGNPLTRPVILPDGFVMSKKGLAEVMERVRVSRLPQRQRDPRHG